MKITSTSKRFKAITTIGLLLALVGAAAAEVPKPVKQRLLLEGYGKLPLSFEANQGQTDRQVKFLSRGRGYTLFLTSNEAVLALRQHEQRPEDGIAPDLDPKSKTAVLRMKLAGANPAPAVEGVDELQGKSSYFIGNDPTKWRSSIPTYAKVEYREVYPGVNLVYYGNQGRLEYDFVVAPGADPKAITLAFEGGDSLAVDAQGDLLFKTEGGEIRVSKPLIYQEVGGMRQEISGRYVLNPKSKTENPQSHWVGFQVAAYDSSRPLVIDPVLDYSTYLLSNGSVQPHGIAVDAAGNAYVTGRTASSIFPPNLPTTAGAFQPSSGGGGDAFVTKLDPTGSALVYSTYLGGSSEDGSFGIAVDAAGNAYVTGNTDSTNFPTTTGAFDTTLGSIRDAFVTKLDPTGSSLVYSTYLGGSLGLDEGFGIAADAAGNAYVTGKTSSTDFPTTLGAFNTTFSPGSDGFVTKLNPTGSALVYSTFLSSSDIGLGIAVDVAGNAYVTGITGFNFPTTAGAFDTTHNGGIDAFVTKLDPLGSALLYSTYLGGSGTESDTRIAVDAAGNAYVTGHTDSTNFPTTAGAFQTASSGGGGDAFVTKLDPAGSALVYSTYLGGSGLEIGFGIAVDALDNAYVTGVTTSNNFPTTAGAFLHNGAQDAFVTKLNPTGSALVYSTYLGGAVFDRGDGIAVDADGNAYVTGITQSTNFPTTAGAFQPTFGGSGGGFVTKLAASNQPPVANAGGPYTVAEGGSVTLAGSGSDPEGDPLTFAWDLDNNGSFETPGQNPTFSAAGRDGPSSQTVVLRVCDNQNACTTSTATVSIDNVAPAINILGLGAARINENGSVNLTVMFTDPGIPDSHTVSVNWGDGGASSLSLAAMSSSAKSVTLSHQYLDDNPTGTASDIYSITVIVTDKDGGSGAGGTGITVNNVPPTVGTITAPAAPVQVNTPITTGASFTDPGGQDTHAAVWDWGDGTTSAGTVTETGGSGSVSGSHTYAAAGVYTVTLTVIDDDGGAGQSVFQYVVVFDPAAGFVTGAGWIDSPPGAYVPNPSLTGRAHFGFTSRYHSGANVPTGNTGFRFQAADLDFHSTAYAWLVVGGARAQYRGTGTINGAGSYDFILTAIDGALPGGGGQDKFRIKIFGPGGVVYDNQMGATDAVDPTTVIGAGNIVIHK